jgi:hypothetical protein
MMRAIGISAGDIENLFQKFYRGKKRTIPQDPGNRAGPLYLNPLLKRTAVSWRFPAAPAAEPSFPYPACGGKYAGQK